MTENAPSLADQVAKDMAYLAVVKTGAGANEAHTRLANVLLTRESCG